MKLIPPNITPGPWQVSQTLGIGQTVTDSRENLIGFCDAARCDATENRTNARAIAATPDTLAALAELAQGFVNREVVRRYGEKPADMTDSDFVRLVSADAWDYAFLKNARAALLKAGCKIEE